MLEDVLTATLRNAIAADLERLHLRAIRDAGAVFDMHEPDAPRDETLRWTLDEVLGDAP